MKRIIAHISFTLGILMPLACLFNAYHLYMYTYLDAPRIFLMLFCIGVCPLSAYGFISLYQDLMASYRLSRYCEDRPE
jgi:hypothetical protein